jgi:hypothetical protein
MSLRYASEAQHNFGSLIATGTLLAAVTGRRLFIYRLLLTVTDTSGATTVQLQDTASNNMSQAFQFVTGGGLALDVPFNNDPWWFTGQGLAGAPLVGQGLGINAVITGSGSVVNFDVWWDSHP